MALWQNSKFLVKQSSIFNLLKLKPLIISKRTTTYDSTNRMCGKREYVGFGVNGSPVYIDLLEYPMPAIRFREPTPEICALRKKEVDDWKKLSKEEIKRLYRYSFCKTYSEIRAPSGEWKSNLGFAFWAVTFSIWIFFFITVHHQDLPITFQEDRRQAQLKRMIALQVGAIDGLSSKWDYEIGDWK